MYIRVHRGTGPVGENLIEIGTRQTRLLFDAGADLPLSDELDVDNSFELEGLTCGKPAFDWMFLSHHHSDHCGLPGKLLPGIPMFAGDATERVLNVTADFTHQPRPEINFGFRNCQPIQLDDIRVTPIGWERSAQDAYMFLIQAEGKNVLYTGDYRAVEHISPEIRRLLGIAGKLDLLIAEGTRIRTEKWEEASEFRCEDWITRTAAGRMRLYAGPVFVLCSPTDEERILAISRAAYQSDRLVFEDLFQWAVRGKNNPEVRHFAYASAAQDNCAMPYFKKLSRQGAPMSAEQLAVLPERKVIFVRASMIPFIAQYMDAQPPQSEEPLLIYSMWQGYKQTAAVGRLLDFCQEREIRVVDIHRNGHAYKDTIRQLMERLYPAALLPIHCDQKALQEFNCLHYNCLTLCDGERWEVE